MSTAIKFLGNILLVEDNTSNSFVFSKMLLCLGYQVESVNNGYTALQYLENKHYDLVLIDCWLPGLDGFQTTRYFRQIKGFQKYTSIIAMSGFYVEGTEKACLEAGIDAYLQKPFTIKDFTTLASQLLNSALERRVNIVQSVDK